jgi:hypothetical protein
MEWKFFSEGKIRRVKKIRGKKYYKVDFVKQLSRRVGDEISINLMRKFQGCQKLLNVKLQVVIEKIIKKKKKS